VSSLTELYELAAPEALGREGTLEKAMGTAAKSLDTELEPAARARIAYVVGNLHIQFGRSQEAQHRLEQSVALYEGLPDSQSNLDDLNSALQELLDARSASTNAETLRYEYESLTTEAIQNGGKTTAP